uniref:Spermatosis and centriole associated 1 like n=1 Tax=Pseudonaja textilis TaxID=8673 RepID=A0A670XZ83_PSETE
MTEEREWIKRIQEENAHLKNQIRLLRENYELRTLLSQSENNNQAQFIAPQISPTYPDSGSLGKAGKKHTKLASHYKTGGLLNPKEKLNSSTSWPEESPSSKTHKEDAQAQMTFSNDVNIPKGRSPERQSYCLGANALDTSIDKTQLESQEMPRKKRVWFSDSPATDKLRKFHTFYLNEIAQNNKKNGRIVGEIAFQLDRRILAHVFPGITRLYGFTVSNIPEKIKQVSTRSLDGSLDEKKYRAITQRYHNLITRLEKMGYRTDVHPVFSEFLINTYGILKQRPDLSSNPMNDNPNDLRKMVIDIVPAKFLGDTLLLLNCLCELSKEDNKALFAW